jgi:predicted porin
MKKMACAAAALLAAGATHAQSSLQIYGVIDTAVSRYSAEGAGSINKMTSGGNQQSRLGFRGVEDLGGNLYAGFELESGLNTDDGTGQISNSNNQPSGNGTGTGITFNRKAFVKLGGDWGEVRAGRDYVPSFWVLFAYDPFRTGVGFGSAVVQGGSPITQLRASNAIEYSTRTCLTYECKGFWGQAMYAVGENPSGTPTSSDGRVAGLRVGYGGEKWNVAASQTKTKNLAVGDFTQTAFGATWDFNVARLLLLAGEHRTGKPVAALNNGTKAPFWQIGGFIYVGPGYIPVAYTRVKRNDVQDSGADKFAIGYVYSLSKQTALYTTYAHINNKGTMQLPVNVGANAGPTPVAGGTASGIDLGVRYNF